MHFRPFQDVAPFAGTWPRCVLAIATMVFGCLWQYGYCDDVKLSSSPQIRFVAIDSAEIRAGPGTNFYPTNRLTRGTRLECYHATEDDWVAIRPPNSSFSVVAQHDLELTKAPQIGRVTSATGRSWIGSRLMGAFDLRSSVQLKVGELVTVRGLRRVQLHHTGAAQTMYEIAPPSGEFRWIRRSDLHTEPTQSVQQAHYMQSGLAGSDSFVARRGVHRQTRRNGLGVERNPNRLSRSITSLETFRVPGHDAVDELTIELTSTITQPVKDWKLNSLQRQAANLAQSGETIVIRGRAHKFLTRIERFVSLQNSVLSDPHDSSHRRPDATVRSGNQSIAVGTGVRKARFPVPSKTHFGWLLPTVSVLKSQQRIPPYVLKDDLDKVIAFVTPLPGLNLHRYQKQRVQVFGEQGFLTQHQLPHLTAERVVPIDARRR